jgi:4-oxalomesaconate hydratase
MTNANKTGLVVTAHPGDFVWRAGGAIALHARKGYRIKIACLSFGERGESQFAWKESGATRRSGPPRCWARKSNSSMPAITRCG